MDGTVVTSVVIVAGLLLLLASGVWIFASMLVVSIGGLYFLDHYSLVRIGSLMTSVQWRAMTSFELAALPLFVWMGEILFRTRLSEQIFRGLRVGSRRARWRRKRKKAGDCVTFAAVGKIQIRANRR